MRRRSANSKLVWVKINRLHAYLMRVCSDEEWDWRVKHSSHSFIWQWVVPLGHQIILCNRDKDQIQDSTEGEWRGDQWMESHMASEHTSQGLRRMEVRGEDWGIYCDTGWLIVDWYGSQQNVLCSCKHANLMKGAIQRWGGCMSGSIGCGWATGNRRWLGTSWRGWTWQRGVTGIGDLINVRTSLT